MLSWLRQTKYPKSVFRLEISLRMNKFNFTDMKQKNMWEEYLKWNLIIVKNKELTKAFLCFGTHTVTA